MPKGKLGKANDGDHLRLVERYDFPQHLVLVDIYAVKMMSARLKGPDQHVLSCLSWMENTLDCSDASLVNTVIVRCKCLVCANLFALAQSHCIPSGIPLDRNDVNWPYYWKSQA